MNSPTFRTFAIITAALAVALHAAPEQGPTTFSPGAPQLTTGNLVLDSALDSSGGNVASSASFTLKPGFVGQLYEVVALGVSAQPAAVAEGAAAQLSATGTLDDDTALSIAPSAIAWSVQIGPLVSISVGGLVTAGLVYGDTAATARGVALGFTADAALTVLDSDHDNFGPVAGDGIDDAWQFQFFDADQNGVLEGPEIVKAGPAANPDHDPSNNFLEWAGGFNPLSNASYLSFKILSKQGQLARLEINKIHAGTTYRVKRTESLETVSTPFQVFESTPTIDANDLIVEDPAAFPASAFYRLFLERAP
jgi:hypothetical protein